MPYNSPRPFRGDPSSHRPRRTLLSTSSSPPRLVALPPTIFHEEVARCPLSVLPWPLSSSTPSTWVALIFHFSPRRWVLTLHPLLVAARDPLILHGPSPVLLPPTHILGSHPPPFASHPSSLCTTSVALGGSRFPSMSSPMNSTPPSFAPGDSSPPYWPRHFKGH